MGLVVRMGMIGQVFGITNTRTLWPGTSISANGALLVAATTIPNSLLPLSCMRNVNNKMTAKEANTSRRATVPIETSQRTLIKVGIDADVPYAPTDTTFQFLQQNWYAGWNTQSYGESMGLFCADLNTITPGVQGTVADFQITEFPRDEQEEKEMETKMVAMVTDGTIPLQYVLLY